MRDLESLYDVEQYARALARVTAEDYVRFTPPEEREEYVALDQLYMACDDCEAVLYYYHAASVVFHARGSQFIDELPTAHEGEDWDGFTQRCACSIMEQIAVHYFGDFYKALDRKIGR